MKKKNTHTVLEKEETEYTNIQLNNTLLNEGKRHIAQWSNTDTLASQNQSNQTSNEFDPKSESSLENTDVTSNHPPKM